MKRVGAILGKNIFGERNGNRKERVLKEIPRYVGNDFAELSTKFWAKLGWKFIKQGTDNNYNYSNTARQ